VRFLLDSDSQSPSNVTLSRRVRGVFVQRKWFGGVGNNFTPAAAASIDARPDGYFSGPILLVELRTDADFHVVATLEECHASPLFVDDLEAFCRRWLEDIGPRPSDAGRQGGLNAGHRVVSCKRTWDSAQTICTTS
jgi:hypothetical protein